LAGSSWYGQDWSTSPRLPESAPWIEVNEPRERDVADTVLAADERHWRLAPAAANRTARVGRASRDVISALKSGDHVWYYDGKGNANAIAGEQMSTDLDIPRLKWFPSARPGDKTDYRDNGTHIFEFVIYDNEIRMGQPHLTHGRGSFAWLNNNPGNITGVAGGPDFGQFAGKFNWHNFLIFPDYGTGFAAIASFLGRGPYPNLSILEAFRKYAPAGDGGNRPDDYAAELAAAVGVPVSTLVRELSQAQMLEMQTKIVHIEGSIEGTTLSRDSQDVPQAIRNLLGGAPSPGRPAMVGPQSADRSGAAPVFALEPGGGSSIYWHVEVATEVQLLDGGEHGDDTRFYASWVSEPFGATGSWTMPDEVWARMCGADAIYYRAFFSSSSQSWEDIVVTVANENWALAPFVQLTGEAAGGSSSGDNAVGTIVGPSSVVRGEGAPVFDLTPAQGSSSTYYAVEVATDAVLFDGASHTLEDGFYGSWSESSFLSESTYQLPDHVWEALCGRDALYYRAWFNDSESSWDHAALTTLDGDGRSAPSISITEG
jgi:hypothetical protein